MNWKETMDKLHKNWIISAVLIILVGLVLVIFPSQTLSAICYVLGGIAIAMGVVRTVRYFKLDHTYPYIFQSDLMVGLIAIALGIFMISQPKAVLSLLPFLFGLLLIGCGIGNILRAVDAKKAQFAQWSLLLALAIVSIVLGGVILFNPFAVMETVVIFIGAGLIYQGVTDLITTLVVKKRLHEWKKSV